MKKIAILGSTGSIGTQTLGCSAKPMSDMQVVGHCCRKQCGEAGRTDQGVSSETGSSLG